MKFKLFLLLLLTAIPTVHSQETIAFLSGMQRLYTAFNEVDLEEVSNLLCTDQDKKVVYEQLDTYFQNEESKFRFVERPLKFTTTKSKSPAAKYRQATFSNMVRITYFKPMTPEEIEVVRKSLLKKFNAQSVVYETARNAYVIMYDAKLIGIPSDDGWKFTFIDNTLPENLNRNCLDENVKKELGL